MVPRALHSQPVARSTGDAAEVSALAAERLRSEGTLVIRQGLIHVVGRVLVGLIGLVLVPVMWRGLGPEMYGFWIAALTLCELVNSLDFGLGWSVTRQVAGGGGDAASVRFVSSAFNAYLLLGGAAMLLIAGAGYWMPQALGISTATHALAAVVFATLGVAVAADWMVGYSTGVLYGLRRFGLVTLVYTALALLRGIGLLVLLTMGYGVPGLALWYAAATWITALVALLGVQRLAPAFVFRFGILDWRALRSQMGFSLASQLTTFATAAIAKAPVMALGFMRSAEAIVPYHVGQRLPVTAGSMGGRMAEAAFPAAGQHQRASDTALGRQVLLVSTRWSVGFTLPLMVVMAVLAPWALTLWLGTADPQIVAVLRISAGVVLMQLLGATALHWLWGRGQVQVVLLASLGMAAGTLAAALLLVPAYGVLGAAWSALGPMLVGSLLLLQRAARECGLSLPAILRATHRGLLLPALASGLLAWMSTLWFSERGWLAFLLTSVAAGLLYAALVCLFGMDAEERRVLADVVPRGGSRAGDSDTGLLWRQPARMLRGAADLAANLRYFTFDDTHTTRDYYERLFEQRDPWGYLSLPERGAQRFGAALKLLEQAHGAHRFADVLEIGCAEGEFTALLAPCCRSLLAVDISDTALRRAAQREYHGSVKFRRWDLLRDEPLQGEFDLVVVMGVLENFMRPEELRRLRERLVRMLRPGAHLLVGTTRAGGDLEDIWWRRWAHRGRWMNRFVGRHPALQVVAEHSGQVAVHTLYRRRL